MRVDKTTSQASTVNHIASGVATAIGSAIFIKATGLANFISHLNPLPLFTREPLTPEAQSALEEAKESAAKTAKEAQDLFGTHQAAVAAKAAAENAHAEALKAANAANEALVQHEASITNQNNDLTAITKRCTGAESAAAKLDKFSSDKGLLNSAAQQARLKLELTSSELQHAKKVLENAQTSAASAAANAAEKIANLNTMKAALTKTLTDAQTELNAATTDAAKQTAQTAVDKAQNELNQFVAGIPQQESAIAAAKKEAEALVAKYEAAIPGAETIKQAEEAAKTATEKLKAIEDQIAKESPALTAEKIACDTDIPSATTKLGELTEQKPNLVTANATAYDTLDKVKDELAVKVTDAERTAEALAKAQETADAAAEAASKDTIIGRAKETASEAWAGLKTRASNLVTSGKELIVENQEFLGATAGFACTYYAVDFLASEKIKNRYARGAFSFATAFVAVWTASNFGFKNEMHATTTLMYGASTIGATLVGKYLAPHAGELFSKLYHGANWLGSRNLTIARE